MMDIGEVVRASGLPASTLRHYEREGLIRSTGRNGLRRSYHPNVVQALAIISLGRSAGFSLKEIAEIFNTNSREIDRERLLQRVQSLEQEIKRLHAIRRGLLHVAHCPEASHFECPKFLKLLHLVTRGRWKRKPNNMSKK